MFCLCERENVQNFENTHLLQKILRPVKVLLPLWWQPGAGAAEVSSALEDEEVAEVEAKVPSTSSGCSSSGC